MQKLKIKWAQVISGIICMIPGLLIGLMIGVELGAPWGVVFGMKLAGKTGARIGYFGIPLFIALLFSYLFFKFGVIAINIIKGILEKTPK